MGIDTEPKEEYVSHDDKMREVRDGWKKPELEAKARKAAILADQQKVQKELASMYHSLFSTKEGAALLEDLERLFAGHSILKKDPTGKIDAEATIASAGSYEVISYIKRQITNGDIRV